MESHQEAASRPATPELTPRELDMLAFERRQFAGSGAKEEAIAEAFGLSAARYYQMLNVVIDSVAAIEHDPMLVKRLQRLRDSRTRARSAGTVHGAETARTGAAF